MTDTRPHRGCPPVAVLVLMSCVCGPGPSRIAAQDEPAPLSGTWIEGSLAVEGGDRWFRTYQPRALAADAPAVLLLHGGTQSMRKLFLARAGGTRAWPAVADREGFLLIVPNGTNPTTGDTRGDEQNWNDLRPAGADRKSQADDVGFIVRLLDEMARRHRIDTRRVYVTGASNGGMMAYRLLVEVPERFAAAATFIAVLPADLQGIEPPATPTPVLIANGTADPLVRWEGGPIRGQRTRMMSVADNLDWWIRANRADRRAARMETLPDESADDGCRLSQTFYPAEPGGAPVLFVKMEGGGHALPSRAHALPDTFLVRRLIGPLCRDAEGAEIAWEFMSQFRR
jgi:polyhydroxybutyrate depolymerase